MRLGEVMLLALRFKFVILPAEELVTIELLELSRFVGSSELPAMFVVKLFKIELFWKFPLWMLAMETFGGNDALMLRFGRIRPVEKKRIYRCISRSSACHLERMYWPSREFKISKMYRMRRAQGDSVKEESLPLKIGDVF